MLHPKTKTTLNNKRREWTTTQADKRAIISGGNILDVPGFISRRQN
jgi:hypothetical protein